MSLLARLFRKQRHIDPFAGFVLPQQWIFVKREENTALYRNECGDYLSLNYFGLVPDIAANLTDLTALRGFYREKTTDVGMAMLEVDVAEVAGIQTARTLLKGRMQPRGFAFLGSFTFPFADCSYVVKVQCTEGNPTGMRESMVMIQLPELPQADEATGKLIGWERDPYDVNYRGDFMANLADDAQYDAQFADHPLSRARRYLAELQNELKVPDSFHGFSAFEYGF
ncbi:hypothetical protein [Andreprevotia lacus]|nr:hypothetical protein [Andreprevotia lacus]